MTVLALGINHHSAPLDLRSRFAFTAPQLPAALRSLRERLHRAAPEATLLSTCNRTELYVAATQAHSAAELAQPTLDWLAEQGGLGAVGGVSGAGQLAAHAYVMEDGEAARHAFRVASGLDSMVLGEPQILGQIKLAVREAGLAGTLGSTLNQLFQRSFSVAKEVRTATEIGAHSVSMAAATVRLATQLFDLHQARVLLVGAGEMIELMAAHFASQKPLSITVANRTLERGELLVERVAAHSKVQMLTMQLSDLPQRLGEFDVVVSCTASSLPIIGLGAVERALKARRKKPIFMVDLAVPRDIEPEVARLSDVYLYTVDDLSALVQTAGEKRQLAVARAEEIVDAGVKSFSHWMEQRTSVPLIQALNHQAEEWQAAELARARRLLAKGGDIETVMQSLARGLSAKLMHGAMTELRGADDAQRDAVSDAVARLFLRPNFHRPNPSAASSPLTH
jgi:glutamyl-tRNA reductase